MSDGTTQGYIAELEAKLEKAVKTLAHIIAAIKTKEYIVAEEKAKQTLEEIK